MSRADDTPYVPERLSANVTDPGRRMTMKFDIDYHAIYDNAPDLHISIEAGSGQIIECNQTLLDRLGYTKDEVLSKTKFEIYHPDGAMRKSWARHITPWLEKWRCWTTSTLCRLYPFMPSPTFAHSS